MPEIAFLTSTQPLVCKVADSLVAHASVGPMDLGDSVVLLPTGGAARRLGEQLANLAVERGTGLLPPRMMTPMAFPAAASGSNVAGRSDCLLAWMDVLALVPREDFPQVLSGFSDHAHPSISLRIAGSLFDLSLLLAEAGVTLASKKVFEVCAFEEERW